VSHYVTDPAKFGNTRINYDLSNTFFRNGASLSRPVGEVAGRALFAGVSFVDTRTTGDRTAVSSWQEYSAFIGLGGAFPARLSATYIDGRNGFSAFRAGLAVAF
jgi:hypothetical protein